MDMESGVITIAGLEGRVRELERNQDRGNVELEAVKDDVQQINARLDRAARAGYFVGTSLMTLAAVVLGAVIVPH